MPSFFFTERLIDFHVTQTRGRSNSARENCIKTTPWIFQESRHLVWFLKVLWCTTKSRQKKKRLWERQIWRTTSVIIGKNSPQNFEEFDPWKIQHSNPMVFSRPQRIIVLPSSRLLRLNSSSFSHTPEFRKFWVFFSWKIVFEFGSTPYDIELRLLWLHFSSLTLALNLKFWIFHFDIEILDFPLCRWSSGFSILTLALTLKFYEQSPHFDTLVWLWF